MSKNVVKEIYMFEIPSSTEWAFGQFNPVFCPDVFYDISGTLEIKIRAMQIYESEIRQFPHPRSPEALTAVASRWGTVAGIQSAEAFKLLRLIR
jgi:LmbE family N-acetylglucosaminyl deacetylase